MLRVLVVDRAHATRDAVAAELPDCDVAWASRDAAQLQLRAALTSGRPFDVVLLEADPALSAAVVRELSVAGGGARVVLMAVGSDGLALAARCGASDVVGRPFAAGELAF